jgi:hypothetical protein
MSFSPELNNDVVTLAEMGARDSVVVIVEQSLHLSCEIGVALHERAHRIVC